MNNCGPSDSGCDGTTIIPCGCFCDHCETHNLECVGCINCDDETTASGCVWVNGLDARWLICSVHPDEARVKVA